MWHQSSLVLIVTALVAAVSAIKFRQHDGTHYECIKHCDEVPEQQLVNYVHFFPGKTHTYRVQVTNKVQVKYNNHSDINHRSKTVSQVVEENLIQIAARAMIVPLNQCETMMKLDHVEIKFFNMASGPFDVEPLKHHQDSEVERLLRQFSMPILFGYKDGIVTEVCHQREEELEPYVINVKKSIIGALQTAPKILQHENSAQTSPMIKVLETDYYGDCETEYNVTAVANQPEMATRFIINKHKDLLQCAHSPDDFPDLGNLVKQSKRAEADCRQQIESFHLTHVECRAERSLDTMMTHFGIDLVAAVNLTEMEIRDATAEDRNVSAVTAGWSPDRLIKSSGTDLHPFLDEETRKPEQDTSRDDLQSILKDLCEDIGKQNRIGAGTPALIQRLAAGFRTATVDDVNFIYENEILTAKVCPNQSKKLKDLFVDTAATVMADSTGTLIRQQMLELMAAAAQDPIAHQRARMLAISMAFAREPSVAAIQDMIPELFEKIHDAEILLSLSALVRKTDSNGLKERLYGNLLNFVVSPKTIQALPEVDIVRLLKAVENVAPVGNLAATRSQETLIPVMNGDQYPELIRFTAIKSLESLSLTDRTRQTLLAIVANPAELVEIRIIAYRTLINTGSTAEELQQILDIINKEKSENLSLDVYNYVCSHQKMLRTTVDQRKRSALPPKAPLFPEPVSLLSQPLLSRHYEYSIPVLLGGNTNLGSIIETDVIMAKGNGTILVPRMIILNVTVPDGRGEQMPLVELAVRQQGLEKYIGKMIQQVIASGTTNVRDLFGRLDQMMAAVDNKSQSDGDVRLQVLANVDGRSMFVYDSADQRNNLWEIIEKLKQKFPIQIDETMVVMPVNYRVPVASGSSGQPGLFFEVNTTYVASFDGKIVQSNNQTTVEGQQDWFEMMIKPTIVAETSAGIRFLRKSSGTGRVRFTNQIVVAPTVHVKTRIDDEQKLTIKLLLPEKEQTWFRSQTRITKANEEPQPPPKFVTKCIIDSMKKFLGVNICHKKLVMNDGVKSGLVDYSAVTLVKDDDQMEGIELTVQLPKQIFSSNDDNRLPFGLIISTPGSVSFPAQRFATEIIINAPHDGQNYLLVEYRIEILRKKWHGQLVTTDNVEQKSIKFELKNEKEENLATIQLSGPVGPLDWNNFTLKFQAEVRPSANDKTYGGQGIISHRQQNSAKSNLDIKLEYENKPIMAVTMVKNCPKSNESCRMSWMAKMNVGPMKLHHNWLYQREADMKKSVHHIEYNEFWKRSSNKMETIDIKHLVSAFKQDQTVMTKRFFHYEQISSQFPTLNLVLGFNEKRPKSDVVLQEASIQYGKNLESNQIRLNRQTRTINQSNTVRYDSELNLVIKPKNLNYKINQIVDYTVEPKKIIVVATKIQDSNKIMLDSNFRYEQQSAKPYRAQTVGEMKLLDGRYILAYKDHVDEKVPGNYHGKIETNVISPDVGAASSKWLPKRLLVQYRFKTEEADDQSHSQHTIGEILLNFQKFEYQLFAENEHFGHCGQMGLLEISAKTGNGQLRNVLRREGEQIYDLEAKFGPVKSDEKRLQLSLDTIQFDQFRFGGEFRWNIQNQSYLMNLTAKNENFHHETMMTIDSFKVRNINTETKHSNRKIFAINYNDDDESKRFQIDLNIPKYDFEHQTKIQIDESEKRLFEVLALETKTRRHHHNVLQFSFHSEPFGNGTHRFQGKFGGDLQGSLSMGKMSDMDSGYQFHLDLKAPQKQFIHESNVRWTRRFQMVPDLVDVKNFFGQENLFDFRYKQNSPPETGFGHQIMASTRTTQAQILWSWPMEKASFDLKTKSFGGISHRTDLEQIDLPSVKFTSDTRQNNRKLIKVTGDLKLVSSETSTAIIVLGDEQHRIHLQVLPMKELKIETNSKNGWIGSLRAERSAPEHLIVKIDGHNQKQGQFRIDLDHQCNQYTRLVVDSHLLRAKLDHDVAGQTLEFRLRGLSDRFQGWQHQTQAIWSAPVLKIHSETKQNDQRLVWVDIVHSDQRFTIDLDSDLEQFPVAFRTLIKLDGHHIDLEAVDKCHNRHVKFETKADDWKDFRFECAWGRKQPEPITKRILVAIVKQQEAAGRVSGQMHAQWFEHQASGELDFGPGGITKGNHQIRARYANLETNDQKSLAIRHQYQNDGLYQTEMKCYNGLANILSGAARLDCRNENRMDFTMKTKTDLDDMWDLLNSDVKFQNDYRPDGVKQEASIETGTRHRRNSIVVGGQNSPTATEFIVKMTLPWWSPLEHTGKLQWNKPERRLQMNIYNDHGRLVDVNVDLFAKALRKKFQIVSFVDLVPTVDAEATFGENSYLVLAVSFRQQKRMELNMKWFGQWRQDYRAEILFRCYAYPEFEMMIISHHPASFDKIDAMIKYRNSNQEDMERKTVQISLVRRRTMDADNPQQEITTYEGKMDNDGEYRNEIKAKVVKNSGQINKIEMEWENGYQLEVFYRYRENQTESAMRMTGIAVHETGAERQPVFIATYLEPPAPMNESGGFATTMARLYLPGNVDYRMINAIAFGQDGRPQRIHSTITRGISFELLAEVTAELSTAVDNDDRIIEVQLESPRFQNNPKTFQLRYNFQSPYCSPLLSKPEWMSDQTTNRKQECTRMRMIFGKQEQPDEYSVTKPLLVQFEFARQKPIMADGALNHSVLFSIESLAEPNPYRALNFTIIGHVSLQSIGFQYENVDRYGDRKSGQWYMGLNGTSSTAKRFDFFHQCHSEQNSDDDYGIGIHFQPSDIRKTLDIEAKWNPWQLRRWFTTENGARIESLTARPDLCEWRLQFWRRIQDETRHKWFLFKRYHLDRELALKTWEEIRFVRRSMDGDPRARQIIEFVDHLIDDFRRVYSKIDLNRLVEEFLAQTHRLFDDVRSRLYAKMEQWCNGDERCRRLYGIVWNYEMKRAVKRMIGPVMEHRYFPQTLKTMLQDTIGQSNRQPGRSVRPPPAEGIFEPICNIIQEISDPNTKINWPEMKENVHDLVMAVVDEFWSGEKTANGKPCRETEDIKIRIEPKRGQLRIYF